MQVISLSCMPYQVFTLILDQDPYNVIRPFHMHHISTKVPSHYIVGTLHLLCKVLKYCPHEVVSSPLEVAPTPNTPSVGRCASLPNMGSFGVMPLLS